MSQIVQLHVVSGANIEGGVNITGGLNADSITQAGQPVAGTVHVGGNGLLTGDGSVGNPLTAVSQFGADTIIQQADSSSVLVNTLELANVMDSNSHLSVTAHLDMITPVSGQQVTRRLTSLNATGIDKETTNTSTPSVALKSGCDLLLITIGTNATSLTITGTSTDADFCYEVCGVPVVGNGTVNLQLNGNAGAWTALLRYSTSASGAAITTASVTAIGVVDSATNGGNATFTARIRGAQGAVKVVDYLTTSIQSGQHFMELGTGFSSYTNGTNDVTSIVLSGNLLAGSVISVQRGRITSF